MSDPATLKDCPFCNGTNYPEDRFCYFCKKEVWTVQRIKQEEEMIKHEKEMYQEFLMEKKNE